MISVFQSFNVNVACVTMQDGSERTMESLSLIDAVMPDRVEARKQAIAKNSQVKTEASNTNGDETSQTIGKSK